MNLLRKIAELKEQSSNLLKLAERAKGAADRIDVQLKEEYGCSSEDGEKLVVKMKKELDKEQKEAETAVLNYEDKWKEQLGGIR